MGDNVTVKLDALGRDLAGETESVPWSCIPRRDALALIAIARAAVEVDGASGVVATGRLWTRLRKMHYALETLP